MFKITLSQVLKNHGMDTNLNECMQFFFCDVNFHNLYRIKYISSPQYFIIKVCTEFSFNLDKKVLNSLKLFFLNFLFIATLIKY